MNAADNETFVRMFCEMAGVRMKRQFPILPSPRGVIYSAFPPRNGEQLLASYKGKRKKYEVKRGGWIWIQNPESNKH